MHDEKLIFSHNETVQRVDNRLIDGMSAPTAAGNENVEELSWSWCGIWKNSGRMGMPVRTDFRPKRCAVS